jgi:hypothetical protein
MRSPGDHRGTIYSQTGWPEVLDVSVHALVPCTESRGYISELAES